MSRLIFEGDTTERFGELFPNPFIEQIRLFDNEIQVDIGLYFEVPTDDTEASDYVAYMAENLNVFGIFCTEEEFDRITKQKILSTEYLRKFYKNSFFVLHQNTEDKISSIDLDLGKVELFFNSEGKRFAKALVNFVYAEGDDESAPESLTTFYNRTDERYFASFTSFITPSAEIELTLGTTNTEFGAMARVDGDSPEKANRLKNQTSDLVYEKIFVREELLA